VPNSLKEWLEHLEADLSKDIKEGRRFRSYVGEVICNTESFYTWKKGGRDTVRKEGNATIIDLAPFQTKAVSPIPIRFRLSGDWYNYYEGKTILVLGGICRSVVSLEEKAIFDTLAKDVKVFELSSNVCKLDMLQEAIHFIGSEGSFADTLLVNPLQIPKLLGEKGFIPRWSLGQGYIEQKGEAFAGLLGHLSVYETAELSVSEVLLYEKSETRVRKTPIVVKFDDYSNPKILAIKEDIFAWTLDNESIAKIALKA